MSTEKHELEPSEDHIIAPPMFVAVAVAAAVAVAVVVVVGGAVGVVVVVAVAVAAVAKNQAMSAEFAGNSLT